MSIELPLVCVRRPTHVPTVEFVERKGIGHPDTICDHLSEALARRLAVAYVERTGSLQHFNVDKGLLIAGEVEVGYGRGTVVHPARLILAGRAAPAGIDPDHLHTALSRELATVVPDAPDGSFSIDLELHPPSTDLAPFGAERSRAVPLANDTSMAVVSLPRSTLEELVYRASAALVTPDLRADLPVGTDVKVMGARLHDRTQLTVGVATLADRIPDQATYREVITEVREVLIDHAHAITGGAPVEVVVNNADSPYLTVTGTSAEAGDDGEVGRGNRFGGLITPFREMSMEACAGKHPVAHVGKTYHCMAHDIATELLDEAGEITVGLLSRIGEPVTQPQAVSVETVDDVDPRRVARVVETRLSDWEGVRDRLLAGRYELF